jgi:hypothetical protein
MNSKIISYSECGYLQSTYLLTSYTLSNASVLPGNILDILSVFSPHYSEGFQVTQNKILLRTFLVSGKWK